MADAFLAEVQAYATKALQTNAAMREANRARFPSFTACVDRMRELWGDKSVRVLAIVNDTGDEMGAVDDRLRNLETTFDAAQAGRVFHAPPTPRAVAAAAKARRKGLQGAKE